ncbi:MAG: malate dehydrogenase [Gammaproteobacteria bacterium]
MKIAIIGVGRVGSAIAFAMILKGLGDKLVLANRNVDAASGDRLDLHHCQAFCKHPIEIESCALEEVTDADILVVTASMPMTPTMKSRMELGAGNVALFRELAPMLAKNNPAAIFIIVSNPVDIITWLTTQLTGFPPERVVGVGTLIDSARFRIMLSQMEKVHPDDLRAYVLGEHGPSQFPVFSHALLGSEHIDDNPAHRTIFNQVTQAGFDVYRLKGFTNYAIANATCEVINTIVYDEHRTMPLSTYFSEWHGVRDNCFSIPVVVGREGILRYLHPVLNARERKDLHRTATVIKSYYHQLLG